MTHRQRVRGVHVATAALLAALLPSAPAQEAMVEHRVEPGDTLISLLVPGADWRPVQRANRVADPRRLQPGRVLRIPAQLLRNPPAVAEVVHAYGDVTFQRPGGNAAPLAAGAMLAAGDVVRTGAQSSTTLRFADGSRLLVRPDSTLKLERVARAATTLQLDAGSADSNVPPTAAPQSRRYEIRTPHANLGVRGTEFRASVAGAVARVEVLEGTVAAQQGARGEAVAAGFGSVASERGLATRALPPVPTLTGAPERVERMPLRLAWQAAAGQRVRAQVFAAEEPPRLVLDGVFDGGGARWPNDIPDGRYELRVRAIGEDGLEGRDARAAFVLKARPEPPFATAPGAGARTIDERVRLAWTRNTAAPRVRLQVADTPDFAKPRIDRNDIDAAELAVAVPLGRHHWRVASVRDNGTKDGDQGPFGDAQSFTRIAPPPAPPPAEPQTSDAGVLLRWRGDATPGARWQIQVARDEALATPLAEATVTEPQWLLARPQPGAWFVRVRTIDADGFVGPYGQPQRIEVPHSPWWWLLVPAILLLL